MAGANLNFQLVPPLSPLTLDVLEHLLEIVFLLAEKLQAKVESFVCIN